jgi:hypothetical protein
MYIKYQLVIINIDMQCYMGNVMGHEGWNNYICTQ